MGINSYKITNEELFTDENMTGILNCIIKLTEG